MSLTLDDLRKQLAAFEHLPGDTPVVLANSAEGHGYSPLHSVDDALYVAGSEFSGEWYATEDMRAHEPEPKEWEQAPDEAVPAVFLWPAG